MLNGLINGKWKYHPTLHDTTSNYIVADAIYDTKNKNTVEKFLRQSTVNKNKIIITKNLDKNYSSIIPK